MGYTGMWDTLITVIAQETITNCSTLVWSMFNKLVLPAILVAMIVEEVC